MIDNLDIHAYADRELPPAEMARVEKAIAASPEAQRELEAILSLKTCLHSKVIEPDATAAWKECARRLDELDRVKRTETFVGKYAWGLSALLFVVILGGGLLTRNRGGSLGMGNVASLSSGMTPMATPRISQPSQLRDWLSGQTGQQSTLAIDPKSVVGYAYSDQREGRIVRIRVRDSVGFIDIMLIPNVTRVDGGEPIGDGMFKGQVNGLNCVVRPDLDRAVVFIGDRDPDQLQDYARSVYR